MNIKSRVFDERNEKETLFEGDEYECMEFINQHEDDDYFYHLWIEQTGKFS